MILKKGWTKATLAYSPLKDSRILDNEGGSQFTCLH